MNETQIEPLLTPGETRDKLRSELRVAQETLVAAEADLAQEQAAVNAFRMHCRLKLDDLVDELLALQAEKQSFLTQLQLARQEQELPEISPEEDPLKLGKENFATEAGEALILPTDVPRDKAAEKRLYRELARRFHPDLAETAVERAYSTAMMSSINQAYEKRDIQALYDLAGELEPAVMAKLASIESMEIRQLRQQILSCQRRQRKVKRQLQTLRRENTARLWQRAQRLEEKGDNWWDIVRRELKEAIIRQKRGVARLKRMLVEIEKTQPTVEELKI